MQAKNFQQISILLIFIVALAAAGCGQKSKSEKTSEQKSAQEQEEVKYKVTFIELGSVRCIPCQQMQPIMKSVEEKYGDQVNVVFHDVWTPQGKPPVDAQFHLPRCLGKPSVLKVFRNKKESGSQTKRIVPAAKQA